ncbi:hypothetical protein DPMN_125154 [Dreissena polymorpha]|uniref:TLDc domain-containing protein n=1 Tax=Dreissena polymorpha TaxID=45954 RepID=A0A9D4JSU9_DREPO|nr:hypothetical protein DPMN_125154 [Dreissena polymorpha]
MTGQFNDEYMDQLESWLGTGPKIFTRLYQITRDGCNAITFHQKCDNQGPTVTVLYNQHGSVYGGYGSASWISSSGSYIKDSNAFLFQLKYSGTDQCITFPVTKADSAMYALSSYGPIFGAGHDLVTFKDTVNSSGGYFALNGSTNFGISFNTQGLTFDKIINNNLNVTELEVYSITDGHRKNTPTQLPQPWRTNPEWNDEVKVRTY